MDDLDRVKRLFAAYYASDDTDEQNGIANELATVDVPALVAEVERLRAAVGKVWFVADQATDMLANLGYVDEAEEFQARIKSAAGVDR